MAAWVVVAIKRLISERVDGLSLLALDWFGGEPLLAMDIVEEVQNHAMALAADHDGLSVRSAINTNAFLLDQERFRRLLHCGVSELQIALDGPRKSHDASRVTAGGSGTFDRIWANLLAAKEVEETFELTVRLQLADQSAECILEFLELYCKELGSDDRFKLSVVPLANLGPVSDWSIDRRVAVEVAEVARKNAQALGVRLHTSSAGKSVCHAARANSFVVRSDGTLAKCVVALRHPENRVGRFLEDGRVELDAQKMGRWMRGLESGDETELGCPMLGYADGAAGFDEARGGG
jgi:uncharacterized protein